MGIGALLSAAGAGLLSFFSPCVLPLLPVYIGVLTTGVVRDAQEGPERRIALSFGRQVANTIAFVLGISCVFVALGVGAASLGSIAGNASLNVVLGLVVFAFGLYLAGFLKLPGLQRERRADMGRIHVRNVAGAFLLGLAFSFGWTPCVGPILGSILALAAEQGSAAQGAFLLLVYSLGLCIPFLVLTLASSLLFERLRALYRYLGLVQRIGGILIAVMGLWMIFA